MRRIEAQTGPAAADHTIAEHDALGAVAARLSVSPSEVPARVEALAAQVQKLEKELKAAAEKAALERGAALASQFVDIAGIPVLIADAGDLPADPLRALADSLRETHPDGVVLLAARDNGKATLILQAGPAARDRGIHAGKLVGAIAKLAGGGGGGKPDKAQAGARQPEKIPDALTAAKDLIAKALGA